jgi:hypothetical protein
VGSGDGDSEVTAAGCEDGMVFPLDLRCSSICAREGGDHSGPGRRFVTGMGFCESRCRVGSRRREV